jgi:hypothetical protein
MVGTKSVTKGTMVKIWLTILPPNSFGSLLSSFKCQNDLWMFPQTQIQRWPNQLIQTFD